MHNTINTLDSFMELIRQRNPGEIEFHQAVYEVAQSILPYIEDKPRYHKEAILERMAEPTRVISFRVSWEDDQGNIHINRGYRVQNNNSIGPYKGGIRFHPSVNQSILKFLAFEQTFKNSLTGLPMGGGKGGSNFDPKGKSDSEVMRFCQSFMTALYPHVGPNMDVPAGDIGVGAREIGYLFGQYKRLTNQFVGVLTGKGLEYGGSLIRTEATGYGTVYMMEDMLKERNDSLEDKICLISGSGNVATYAAKKILQLGGKIVTISDSTGYVYDKEGLTHDKIDFVVHLKNIQRGSLKVFADEFGLDFHPKQTPWSVPCDLAFPCATQNEISIKSAEQLINNGCIGVSEGANMPTVQPGIHAFIEAKLLYAPSKAANAGGVAISGLEMSQNSSRVSWSEEELEKQLRTVMHNIHAKCKQYGDEGNGYINYLKGANIAGFIKVANAMLAYGVV